MLSEIDQSTPRFQSLSGSHGRAVLHLFVPLVPALPQTLLKLDLLMQETCVELHRLTQIVLSDVGATMAVFRIADLRFGSLADRTFRIEDCICMLGPDGCADAISEYTPPRTDWDQRLIELSEHSRRIAYYCRTIAECAGVDPDEAYLVGLLHEIGSLRASLNSDCAHFLDWHAADAGPGMLCSLPECVIEYLAALSGEPGDSLWPKVVRAAHRAACMLGSGDALDAPLNASRGASANLA